MARIASIAAFPFPYPQGSQIYVAQQARALAKAGDSVCVFAYGRGEGALPAELRTVAVPSALSPRTLRSGFAWLKPIADAALLARFVAAHRRQPFDVVLAHNVEAALVALCARSVTRVPVIYCAHTLMGHELDAYAPTRWSTPLRRIGATLDERIARASDSIVALSQEGAEVLGKNARGRVIVLPPGLETEAPPSQAEQHRVCAAHSLEPGGYALYSGNLDGYQDLDVLGRCGRADAKLAWPIVIATHDASVIPTGLSQLPIARVADFREMRALCFAAGALLLTRRRTGGFPVKLLNYMEAARPIIAWQNVAPGLAHMRSAWLLGEDAGPAEIAHAIRELAADPALGARLGGRARERLRSHHDWEQLTGELRDFALAGTA